MRRFVGFNLSALAAASCLLGACSSGSSNNAGGGSGGTSGSGSGGMTAAGSGGTSGADASSGAGGTIANLTWRAATLTDFESYPAPGSAECIQFSGCQYEGMFAAFPNEVKTEQWVMDHNIAAVHEKDFDTYVGRTLRVRMGDKMIDAVVYDECADTDCSGCCTRNAMPSGFLIDLEKYTFQRLGVPDGQVEWACVDCPP